MANQYEVANVEEAIALASRLKAEGTYNWFRGQVENWPPCSSLERKIAAGVNPEQLEGDLSRFTEWAGSLPELSDLAKNVDAVFAVRQHYGFPTCYIDFTTDPSVAGFFAADSKAPPRAGSKSVIYLLNTADLVDFYCKYYGSNTENGHRVIPVSIDVSNLWRLQAQHGHFLFTDHPWYLTYDMDSIVFPWTGLPAYPPREQIYPEQKSHLELLLDEFLFREESRQRAAHFRQLVDVSGGVRVHMTGPEPDRYDPKQFFQSLQRLPTWSPESLSAWVEARDERFQTAVGRAIDLKVRIGAGSPPPEVQVRAAISGALERESGLRNLAVRWLVSGLQSNEELEIANAVQKAWDGMRSLPISDADLSAGLAEIVRAFLTVDRSHLFVRRDAEFLKWLPDAIEVEFGSDSQQLYSRGYCSQMDLFECLDASVRTFYKRDLDPSRIAQLLFDVSNPSLVFDLKRLASIFVRQLVPSQLVMQRELVLYNPARIEFFGRP